MDGRDRILRQTREKHVPSRVVARMSAQALTENFKVILEQSQGKALIPMVKANAYGHGAQWASRQLAGLPGLYGFGVATLGEGIEVRSAIGAKYRRTPVIVFSGTSPWTAEKGLLCEEHGLTPVIATEEAWRAFDGAGWTKRLRYELKFNTGMNRLGIPQHEAPNIARSLRARPVEEHPQGVLSHMASAESTDSKLTREQLDRFKAVRAEFSAATPSAQFHLANSSAIWNHKTYGLDALTDIARPGISLYGVPPWEGAAARGLAPVMTLEAQVIAVQKLRAGESIGYGGRWVAKEPMRAAVLGAGYADGLLRTLTGWSQPPTGGVYTGGHAWIGDGAQGAPTRFIGVVSMDMSAVVAGAKTQVGDWVQILGSRVEIWAQAKAAMSVPYELLTSVSPRVERVYE